MKDKGKSITEIINVQIKPTKEQIALLKDTASAYMNACNFVSIKAFELNMKRNGEMQDLLYHDVRRLFGLKAQMTCSVFHTVSAKYKTKTKQDKENKKKDIKTKKTREHKPIQFKVPEYDLVHINDYSIDNNTLSINVKDGSRIKVEFIRKNFDAYFVNKPSDFKYKFGTAKYKEIMIGTKTKHYLFIPVTYKVDDLIIDETTNIIGIDRGINFTAVAYSNKHTDFYNGKQIKHKRAKFVALRSQLQKKHTPSSRRRLKRIGSRENRWMRYVNHCVSKALIKNAKSHSLFVIEDLSGVRCATESVKRKDRYVQVSWAFYDLEQKLTYKAQREEMDVIKVSPKYTSQRCPICGHVHSGNRNKSKHIFVCKNCGYRSNDDRIGAMNLAYLGEVYKSADAEGRKQVCDLGLLSTSPKCNVTFDSKPKTKKRKKKGAAAKAAATGLLQTHRSL